MWSYLCDGSFIILVSVVLLLVLVVFSSSQCFRLFVIRIQYPKTENMKSKFLQNLKPFWCWWGASNGNFHTWPHVMGCNQSAGVLKYYKNHLYSVCTMWNMNVFCASIADKSLICYAAALALDHLFEQQSDTEKGIDWNGELVFLVHWARLKPWDWESHRAGWNPCLAIVCSAAS